MHDAEPSCLRETEALRRSVTLAVDALPRRWRRALLFRYVDRLTDVEVCRAIGYTPLELERVLDHARACLQELLLEFGGDRWKSDPSS